MANTMLVIALVGCVLCLSEGRRSRGKVEVVPMPLEYFKNSGLMEAYQNKSTLLDRFTEDAKHYHGQSTSSATIDTDSTNGKIVRIGKTPFASIERSELDGKVDHAGCGLYDQVVEIPNPQSNVIMYPSCVLIQQCGGCPGHPSLACKPVQTKKKTIEVLKYIFTGATAVPDQNVEYIQLEEHTKCAPQCKTTADECTSSLHDYNEYKCQCVCKKQRQDCANNKRWNENVCACTCSNVISCGSGYTYDMETCSCKEQNGRSVDIPRNSESNNVQPEPKDVCPRLSCPRRYKAVLQGKGTCVCQFDRSSLGRRG